MTFRNNSTLGTKSASAGARTNLRQRKHAGASRKTRSRRASDPFAAFAELNNYDIYAGDGHSIKAAAHDAIGKERRPVAHFYLLNLRSRALQHFELALSDPATFRKGEHDMHALKRRGVGALRLVAAKGRKVMVVWDRAGVDFRHWHKAKESGVYFISREKDKMALQCMGALPFDKALACNDGVRRDEIVATSAGVAVRRVLYWDADAVSETEFVYLTSNLKLAPGMIVLLYKRRWDIEKVFDETENRFEETQAWAGSATAKRIQAHMICLTHNLCLLMEGLLATEELLRNETEIKRREERTRQLGKRMAQKGVRLPFVYWAIDRLTQRGVKLIRWIRAHLHHASLWKEVCRRASEGLRHSLKSNHRAICTPQNLRQNRGLPTENGWSPASKETPRRSTMTSTVRAVRWRIGSKNSSSGCSAIGLRARRGGPISFECCFRQALTSLWRRSAGSD